MKLNALRKLGAFAFAGALCLSLAQADDKPAKKSDDAKGGAPDMAEMMKKMEEVGKPAAEHKALDPLIGEWVVVSKFWMAGPEAPATESAGTSSKRWILGGRYLQEDFKGDFLGSPFQGMGLTGYDKMKQKYFGTWIDSMSTAIFVSEGEGSDGNKVLTLKGTMDDPMTGEKNKQVKYVLRILGKDKHVMEMHYPELGDKSKCGEMTYTRK